MDGAFLGVTEGVGLASVGGLSGTAPAHQIVPCLELQAEIVATAAGEPLGQVHYASIVVDGCGFGVLLVSQDDSVGGRRLGGTVEDAERGVMREGLICGLLTGDDVPEWVSHGVNVPHSVAGQGEVCGGSMTEHIPWQLH